MYRTFSEILFDIPVRLRQESGIGETVEKNIAPIITKNIEPKINATRLNFATTSPSGFGTGEAYSYFVDATYGNDSLGTPNTKSKPFRTIKAAVLAWNGLTKPLGQPANVIVAPGTYRESNLLQDNINFVFSDGVEVQNNATTAIFQDSLSQAWKMTISGKVNLTSVASILSNPPTPCGPVFNIVNSSTTVIGEVGNVKSLNVTAINVTDCLLFYLVIKGNLTVNGNVKSILLVSSQASVNVESVLGTHTGIDVACLDVNILLQSINSVNSIVRIRDYDTMGGTITFDPSNRKGMTKIICGSTNGSGLDVRILHSDVYCEFKYATLSGSINVSSPSTGTVNPSATINLGNVTCPTVNVPWFTGKLSFITTGTLDSSGIVMFPGSPVGSGNTETGVTIERLISGSLYMGCKLDTDGTTVVPTHGEGNMNIVINQGQTNVFNACTLKGSSTATPDLKPKLYIGGNFWQGVGYLGAQTYGHFLFNVREVESAISGRGVLNIKDFTATPVDNRGILKIIDCTVRNSTLSISPSSTIACPIYAGLSTNVLTQIIGCVLVLSFNLNDPNLTNPTIRNIEPVYPIENFVNAPLLNITSYKPIPIKFTGDSVTRWTGSNQTDTRVVQF